MEDLIPLLIFIVIAAVNLLKYLAEKGGKQKKTPPPPGTEPPRQQPSTLEDFLEELAGKFEPQPTKLADWPKSRERPDYMQEMEEFEHVRDEAFEEDEAAEIIPMPQPEPVAPAILEVPAAAAEVRQMDQPTSLKSVMKSMPEMITNAKSMRVASAPILRSSGAGQIDFPLKEKTVLRNAIIASLIFSPPRAYDASFDTTIAK